uniref:BHLH domain-containing protein n=1 Tax=Sinocyclocheilus grahami TaxID=75366 RepID=A0A672NGL9_SINGR
MFFPTPREMGSDYGVMDRVSHPLTFGLSLNHQYSPFKDALKNPQNYQEQVNSQRYFRCFSYLSYYGNVSVHNYSLEPAFIHKRNERERQRVRCVNEGYARLREHLPQEFEDKRLSKVETLRAAINYIKHLQNLLEVSLPQGMSGLKVKLGLITSAYFSYFEVMNSPAECLEKLPFEKLESNI